MTKEEILEGNKLIAEFLGLEKTNVEDCYDVCSYLENNPNSTLPCSVPWTEGLYFHMSWDWLMPVVEKIESISIKDKLYCEFLMLNGTNVSIRARDYHDGSVLFESLGCFNKTLKTKIEAVYKSVVDFIKWNNKIHKT